jgi:hypothetical protein
MNNPQGSLKKGKAPTTAFNPNAAGSEDSDEFRVSFADLKKTAPLSDAASGLDSFSDLKSNLPFESNASARVHLDTLQTPEQLIFPKPPMAPTPPAALAINNLKPSRGAWQKYVNDWAIYVRLWDEFDAKITAHFVARKEQVTIARNNKGFSFLGAVGDGGCIDYLNTVHQDNEVRNKWAIACGEHEKRVREFMEYRKRAM